MDNLRELRDDLLLERESYLQSIQDINRCLEKITKQLTPKYQPGDCLKLIYDDTFTYIQIISYCEVLVVEDNWNIHIESLNNYDLIEYELCSKEEFIKFYNKISKELKSKIIK